MKPRILLVDDDPMVSYLLQLLLEEPGRFEVKLETDARRAVKVAKEFVPDLVLMDVTMPGKNGYEVARDLSVEPSLANPEIIFLTGLDVEPEKKAHAGALFLAKPINPKDLIAAVDKCLAARPR